MLAALFLVVRDNQLVYHVSVSYNGGNYSVLDRLFQLHVESANLRVFQQGFQGSVQKHASVRVLQFV